MTKKRVFRTSFLQIISINSDFQSKKQFHFYVFSYPESGPIITVGETDPAGQ